MHRIICAMRQYTLFVMHQALNYLKLHNEFYYATIRKTLPRNEIFIFSDIVPAEEKVEAMSEKGNSV